MPMVHSCSEDGCQILTMGQVCLDHERGAKLAGAALAATLVEAEDLDGTASVLAVRDTNAAGSMPAAQAISGIHRRVRSGGRSCERQL